MDSCKYHKNLFFKFIVIFSIFIAVILGLYRLDYLEKQRVQNTIDIFNNNKRVICKNKFVSKKLGYRLNKDHTKFIIDTELFDIYFCTKADKDEM